jgi:hypothetical protein
MRWAGHVAPIGEERKVHKVSMEKPEGKRLLRGMRRGWEDEIRMDLRETGWEDVECVQFRIGASGGLLCMR